MSIRTRYGVVAAVSSTTAEERDLGNVKWEVVTDVETKGGTWTTVLVAGATDVQLQIDNISSIALLIIRSRPLNPNDLATAISIKRNSALGEAIPIAPLGDSQEGHLVLSTNSLTSVYASNAGTVSMQITVVAAGT